MINYYLLYSWRGQGLKLIFLGLKLWSVWLLVCTLTFHALLPTHLLLSQFPWWWVSRNGISVSKSVHSLAFQTYMNFPPKVCCEFIIVIPHNSAIFWYLTIALICIFYYWHCYCSSFINYFSVSLDCFSIDIYLFLISIETLCALMINPLLIFFHFILCIHRFYHLTKDFHFNTVKPSWRFLSPGSQT